MTPKEKNVAWILKKRKLRQRYVFLTDRDLKYDEGQKGVMLEKLQTRLGKTKEELEAIMKGL
jgi:hypothetical protein